MSIRRLLLTHLRQHHNPHNFLTPLSLHFKLSPRHFSSSPPNLPNKIFPTTPTHSHDLTSITESELRSLGLTDGALSSSSPSVDVLEHSILPVDSVVALLDGYHHLTGLPWWVIIASSTVALRITLFPFILLQLRKLKRIGELFPKLPPPFPPPFSGTSFVDQFSLFRRKRQELQCPSYLWFLASIAVQFPCFILWMSSIRRMSLDHHAGFDTGGILWFQNLTEVPTGSLGPVFPVLIAGLYFCNIQVSFRSSSVGESTGLFGFLVKLYRKYLELLTLPIVFVGFYLPQGSLVYWFTNISLSLIQQVSLQQPAIRQKLGLADNQARQLAPDPAGSINESGLPGAPIKQKAVSAFSLPPKKLVETAMFYLSKGNRDRAIPLLSVALDKDPECFTAWTVMGQAKLQQGLYEEAAEHLETAIYKISLLGETADPEAVYFLISASLSAGVAYRQQGKPAEAYTHFERVKDLKEPDDPAAKDSYFEGLMVFASILAQEGRKDEAAKYARMAAAYNPQYSVFLENLQSDADDFVGPLASSRRSDY